MSAPSDSHHTYTFGAFVLDVERGALTRQGHDIKLRPKSFQLLQYLIERHGCLVSKQEILEAIWGPTIVTDDAVTQCLIDIRRAIDDTSQQMIRTVPRRGYVFEIAVTLGVVTDSVSHTANDQVTQSTRHRSLIALLLVLIVGGTIAVWSLSLRDNATTANVGSVSEQIVYSIAVLPFLDLSPEHDMVYFADGVSEEILNLLAKVDDLRVISRTSSFSFRSQSADISTIRERLGITHVLEGSVRQFGDTIRITAQLVDANSSEHVWSQTYDRRVGHLFDIQDEIAAEVLTRLVASLEIPVQQERATDTEAYLLYLQAVHIVDQLDFSKNAEAEAIMRRSLALDSNFAPAWRELSRILWRQIGEGPNYEEDIARTLGTLQRALELNQTDAATLAYMGWHYADFDGEFAKGARLFERALSMEPSNENVVRTATLFALAFGQPEDAVKLGEFGVSRNPLCFPCYLQLGRAYQNAGQLDDAERNWRTVQSLFNKGFGELGTVLLLKGQPEQALVEFSQYNADGPNFFGKALAFHSLGRPAESAVALNDFLDSTNFEATWGAALAYAWTDRPDEAFDAIDQVTTKDQLIVDGNIVRWNLPRIAMMARHPLFHRLHTDPRWDEFLLKYGITRDDIAAAKFSVSNLGSELN